MPLSFSTPSDDTLYAITAHLDEKGLLRLSGTAKSWRKIAMEVLFKRRTPQAIAVQKEVLRNHLGLILSQHNSERFNLISPNLLFSEIQDNLKISNASDLSRISLIAATSLLTEHLILSPEQQSALKHSLTMGLVSEEGRGDAILGTLALRGEATLNRLLKDFNNAKDSNIANVALSVLQCVVPTLSLALQNDFFLALNTKLFQGSSRQSKLACEAIKMLAPHIPKNQLPSFITHLQLWLNEPINDVPPAAMGALSALIPHLLPEQVSEMVEFWFAMDEVREDVYDLMIRTFGEHAQYIPAAQLPAIKKRLKRDIDESEYATTLYAAQAYAKFVFHEKFETISDFFDTIMHSLKHSNQSVKAAMIKSFTKIASHLSQSQILNAIMVLLEIFARDYEGLDYVALDALKTLTSRLNMESLLSLINENFLSYCVQIVLRSEMHNHLDGFRSWEILASHFNKLPDGTLSRFINTLNFLISIPDGKPTSAPIRMLGALGLQIPESVWPDLMMKLESRFSDPKNKIATAQAIKSLAPFAPPEFRDKFFALLKSEPYHLDAELSKAIMQALGAFAVYRPKEEIFEVLKNLKVTLGGSEHIQRITVIEEIVKLIQRNDNIDSTEMVLAISDRINDSKFGVQLAATKALNALASCIKPAQWPVLSDALSRAFAHPEEAIKIAAKEGLIHLCTFYPEALTVPMQEILNTQNITYALREEVAPCELHVTRRSRCTLV